MIEDRLREQLRRVDELTPPPAPDLAARAMRDADSATDFATDSATDSDSASGDHSGPTPPTVISPISKGGRPGQGRRTWGAWILGAAAAVTIGAFTLTHLPGTTESSSSSAAAGGARAPEAAKGGDSAATPDQGASALASPPGSTPGGVTVVSVPCAQTLVTVRGALTELTKDGLPLVSADCDATGTVVIRVRAPLTTAQRTLVTTRFGPQIAYADLEGKRLP